MAYLFVDKKYGEFISDIKPIKTNEGTFVGGFNVCVKNMYAVKLPKGSIKRLIGYELTSRNKPAEI